MAGNYEPAARRGHVAAVVVGKVYVWGGYRGLTVSHDGSDKTSITFKVDILDVKVSRRFEAGCTNYT